MAIAVTPREPRDRWDIVLGIVVIVVLLLFVASLLDAYVF